MDDEKILIRKHFMVNKALVACFAIPLLLFLYLTIISFNDEFSMLATLGLPGVLFCSWIIYMLNRDKDFEIVVTEKEVLITDTKKNKQAWQFYLVKDTKIIKTGTNSFEIIGVFNRTKVLCENGDEVFDIISKRVGDVKISEKKELTVKKVILIYAIIFLSLILLLHTAFNSSSNGSSSSGSNSGNNGGFFGSDGKYYEYVPEFGDDVNDWMKENW